MRLASLGKILGVIVLLGAGLAIAKEAVYPSGSWRYKITVEVETPEGLKSGSAVREVHSMMQPHPLPETAAASTRAYGEAVVVDLGKRGVLFAILDSDAYYEVFDAFPLPGLPPGAGTATPEGIQYYSHLKNVKAPLKPQYYPMFVHFGDLSDPKSVERVLDTDGCMQRDENGTCIKEQFHVTRDRFEEFFGKGVSLKGVTIEMTDAPMTWGIEKWLPWLSLQHSGNLDGTSITSSNSPSNFLDRENFKVGEKK